MTLVDGALKSNTCDVVVIGGGPGGYVAAIRAAQLGASVVLVEKERLGGTCLNQGCIPSKSLLRTVELLSTIARADLFGIAVEKVSVDFTSMMERAVDIVQRLVAGVRYLITSNNIRLTEGVGRLLEQRTVEVMARDGDKAIFNARAIILATGAKPNIRRVTPFFNLDEILTYQNVWTLQDPPKSLVILGSDVIGIEFAQIFQAVGTQVTVIESQSHILSKEDTEISTRLRQILHRNGITIMTNTQIKAVGHSNTGERIIYVTRNSGEEEIQARKVFVTERVLDIEDLGLDNVGVAYDTDRVAVNDHMETNIPGVYAVGDLTGTTWAHVAVAEGIVAAENAMGIRSGIEYKAVPRCIFTSPEVACVGLTEKEARALNYNIKIGKFSLMANAGALTMRDSVGLVKMITDADTGEILGVHLLGPRATDLIAEAALAITLEATIDEIVTAIPAHPTPSEALWEAALDATDRAIHK